MIDFRHIEATALNIFEERMRQTQQSPKWHAEGDVFTHTMMVVDALRNMPEYQALDERRQHILNIAALMHDVGKILTTTMIDGDWSSPHHAPTGSRMTRELLWKEYGMCGDKELQQVREAICLLIRYHSFPPHAIDMPNWKLKLNKIASDSLLVPEFTIRMLCILSKADMLGRKGDDQKQALERIAFCEELAKEEECLDGCYEFGTDVTRRAYMKGIDVWKGQELYDDSWGEVVMMSGLPGTGKDTWIGKNLKDLPMVSLDNIRREQGISPTDNQRYVVSLAKEQAKEYLRMHQPFVWDATSITAQLRESFVSLCETYRANVRIVYLETDWKTLQQRNQSREYVAPQQVIERMLSRMTLPEAFEARKVEWLTV